MEDYLLALDAMLTQTEYEKHCASQRKKKVTEMCAPIDKIRRMTANDLLEYCGQNDVVPVDLNAILTKVGISALPRDFTELEQALSSNPTCENEVQVLGAIVMDRDGAAIFYNQKDALDSHRCRFTIAHELAHCCLSHQCLNKGAHVDFRTKGLPLTEEEKAANVFAGELLIPYDVLLNIMEKLLVPSVHTLATLFDVSDNVMLKRLDHLKINRRILGYNY